MPTEILHYNSKHAQCYGPYPSKTMSASSLSKQGSMNRDAAVSPAMEAVSDVPGVAADEPEAAAHRQDMAMGRNTMHAYRNASSLAIGAPAADHDPVPGDSSVTVMVAGDPPVTQKAIQVREVEVGPGITLGYHSLDEYKFITSLLAIEEN